MKYYHNPRCAKSRQGLDLLKEKGLEPEIVAYMKEPLTPGELTRLLQQLDIAAEDLVRKKEAVWQEQFAGKELSEDELVLAMIEYPRLMERPILEKGGRAVIGRPPERLLQLL